VDRVGDFLLAFCKAQIDAAHGRICGMYIWGDVAYRNAMLFGASRWRRMFKPHVKRLIELCHEHGLMVIYHGCGNAREIFDDMAEMRLDAYNPLEAKAALDVVKLKEQYAGRLAFCGNIDVRILERGIPEEIRSEVLYKLQAARGGGWIFQSDHSITSDVSPESYELAITTLREHGGYPLNYGGLI
jgi:uroporphyrinogen-III decarboxylase